MYQPMPSLQDILRPLQQLSRFQTQLQMCQHMIAQLELTAPDVIPDVTDPIRLAKQALQQLQHNLEIVTYQLLQIIHLQLNHAYQSSGHLPPIETD